MFALDLITLKDYRDWASLAGNAMDARIAAEITSASRALNTALGRRLVFWTPGEDAQNDNVVVEVALANGALTVVWGLTGPRCLIYTVTDADNGVLSGTITASGTLGGSAVTEAIDLKDGIVQHGTVFFDAAPTLTVAGLQGLGVGDKIKVGSSLGYIDYHTPAIAWGGGTELPLRQWPHQKTAEVNEDAALAYGSTTKLVKDTDYAVRKDPKSGEAMLVRLSSSLRTTWQFGERAVKHVYTGGYTRATVPPDIKAKCRQLVKMAMDAIDKGRGPEVSSWSNALGSGSRFAEPGLSRKMRAELAAYARNRFGMDTAQADYDEEAA